MSAQSSIVWFRQDLRLEDNPALTAAVSKGGPVIPVYIWAPEEEEGWAPGSASKWWLHHSLQSLANELAHQGIRLTIRQGKSLGNLLEIIKLTGADTVFYNRRYEPLALKRDAEIKTELLKLGIQFIPSNASLLFEPWTIANQQGKPYQVFTSFWKQCLKTATPETLLEAPSFSKQKDLKVPTLRLEDLKLLPSIHWEGGIKAAWMPGAKEALKILTNFKNHALTSYSEERNRPDHLGVSRLSPYLHFGEISPRMIWEALKNIKEEAAAGFIRQLGWREFAYHLLYHFPYTVEKPLRKEFENFPWSENQASLKAWQKGQTGFPIVDAGMRELWTTGWMHNRVRMITGSFLVKDLHLPWNEGASFFWDTLVDADLANNTLGWQWVAGCGADAAPFFRIFNPVAQGEKFDPEGNYVRKWVPELKNMPNKWIHKPWQAPELLLKSWGVNLGVNYPFPIVDHAQARSQALKNFATLKKSGD